MDREPIDHHSQFKDVAILGASAELQESTRVHNARLLSKLDFGFQSIRELGGKKTFYKAPFPFKLSKEGGVSASLMASGEDSLLVQPAIDIWGGLGLCVDSDCLSIGVKAGFPRAFGGYLKLTDRPSDKDGPLLHVALGYYPKYTPSEPPNINVEFGVAWTFGDLPNHSRI